MMKKILNSSIRNLNLPILHTIELIYITPKLLIIRLFFTIPIELMMDCNTTDQTNSAIQGQGYYFNRLRESNCRLNRSYRSYYPNSFPETVSFQWEKRPGLPKKLPGETDDDIVAIPLSPPPALHGLGLVLPRPDINYDRWSTSQSHRWTARVWRRISSCSSSSGDRRVPSCSVPISSDLRHLYDDGAVAKGCSSGLLRYSSFSSNSSSSSPPLANSIQLFQCCDKKEAILVRRCSSAGESSRMYYCGGTGGEGVPFNWEMQPGKSKDPGDPDEIEIIPPPTPPPALQSRGLPMPQFDHDDPPVPESSKKNVSCFKYRTGSERRLEEQPQFCCGLLFGHGRRRRRDFTSLFIQK